MSNPQLNVQRSNTAPTPNTKEMKRYTKLKKKAKRFRVLIIGGANAGKTTILRKICNTTDNPEIFDGEGRKININLEPTILRGDHDVENEMVFRKNSTFIFHDSRGFEAGGVEEFEKVKAFISDHARKKKMKDQVHVIWYCVALDDDRPVTYAERQFFSELGTGKVPVIVIFTKCEALELKAIGVLEDEGCDFVDAVEKASVYVREKLKNIHETFEAMRYPPKGHVYLQELEKKNSNCQELVECTIQVLDSKILQGLFISTQQNSLELAVRYSMRNVLEGVLSFMEVITPTIKKTSEKERRKPPSEVETGREGRKSLNEWRIEMFKNVFKYFPYHYNFGNFEDEELRFLLLDKDYLFEGIFDNSPDNCQLDDFFTLPVSNSLAKLTSPFKPSMSQPLYYICGLLILAEHLSVVWSGKSVSSEDIPPTVTLYQEVSCDKVKHGVDKILSGCNGHVPVPFGLKLNAEQEEFLSKLSSLVLENRLDKAQLLAWP